MNTMSPGDKFIPDWVEDFMNRNCYGWSVTTTEEDARRGYWSSAPGLTVPHVFMELEGPIRMSYDGPLWVAINILNTIGAE